MKSYTSDNRKQIAKNTFLLYIRMLFMMIVSLYTSRVILNVLGVEDFGIYNVVGGVVAMFSVISGALSGSISRFITYELGKGDSNKLTTIFSVSVTIQLLLSLIIIILIESIGVWFLNTKMTIPANRIIAANWVLQFSIITFVINLISVPYNATIIAHEKMSAFAYISILEAVGKLSIALLIKWSPMDKLIYYAILMCIVAIMIRFTYGHYCKKHFDECTYHFLWDKDMFKKMLNFAGWNFIGASASILRDQGGNIIINLFSGPSVNAARAVAFQVNNAIVGFVQNFMTAMNPQITKSYASGNKEFMRTLIIQGARFSFYMLLLLSIPVFINTQYILEIWLKIVPDHSVNFVQLILLFALSESISNPLITGMLATGKIRNYQIVVGGIQMLNLPISYICLCLWSIPESVIIVSILISQICFFARICFLRKTIGLSLGVVLKNVYINIFVTFTCAYLLSVAFKMVLFKVPMHEDILFFLSILSSLIICVLVVLFIGLKKNERLKLADMFSKRFKLFSK